jgi:hypothetical protein
MPSTPRLVVRGSTVCRLNGEAVYVIDGDAKTMTPIGADKPRVQTQRRMGHRVRPRRPVVARHGPDSGRRVVGAGREQRGRVKRSRRGVKAGWADC